MTGPADIEWFEDYSPVLPTGYPAPLRDTIANWLATLLEGRPTTRHVSSFEGDTFTEQLQNAATWLRSLELEELGGAGTNVCAGMIDMRGMGIVELTEPINLQNINAFGWGVLGEGTVIHLKAAGKTGLDMLGSRFGHFHGICFYGDEDERPVSAIQVGRVNEAASSADCHQWYSCKMAGFFSGGGFDNLGSESGEYYSLRIFNSDADGGCCYRMDGANYFGITSDFDAPAMPEDVLFSCIQHTFVGSDFRALVSGNAMQIVGGNQIEFKNGYMVSTDSAAIKYIARGVNVKKLWFDVHCEPGDTIPTMVEFTRPGGGAITVKGFRISDHNSHCTQEHVKLGEGVTVLRLEGSQIDLDDADPVANGVFNANGGTIVVSGRVRGSGLSMTGATINGIVEFPGTYDPSLLGAGSQICFDQNSAQIFYRGEHRVSLSDNGAGAGPTWTIMRESTDPAVSDLLGTLAFSGRDSAGNEVQYGRIRARIDDPTDTSEDGALQIIVPKAGAQTVVGTFTSTDFVWGAIPRVPTYTVATLPAAAPVARGVIYVSDGTSNKRLAVSDGTNWRWPDGAVVS